MTKNSPEADFTSNEVRSNHNRNTLDELEVRILCDPEGGDYPRTVPPSGTRVLLIGHHGRVAGALCTISDAAGKKLRKRLTVEILD